MRQGLAGRVCVAFGMVLWAGIATGQVYQLADGAVSVRYPVGHFTSSPAADLLGTAPTAIDPVFECGWWYAIAGVTTREYPLGTPDEVSQDGNRLSFTWHNLSGTGLSLREEVTVADLERPGGGFVSVMSAALDGPGPLSLELFHYLDPDVLGTAAGDQAASLSPFGRRRTLRFGEGTDLLRYSAVNRAGSGVYQQVSTFNQSVRALLNDGDIDHLDDSVVAGPEDLTAAFEFGLGVSTSAVFKPVAQVSVVSRGANDYVKGDVTHTGLYPTVFFQAPDGSQAAWPMRRGARFEDADFPASVPPTRDFVGVDDFTLWRYDQYLSRDRVSGALYLDNEPLVGPALSADWRVAATGDLSHDRKADILLRNVSNQKLAVWVMNGATVLQSVTPTPDQAAHANWEAVGMADFNGDGHRDFLWYNQTSRKLVVWYMDAKLVRITGAFTSPSEVGNGNWRAVAVGDWGKGGAPFGTPDILWQNDTSGKLVLWNMDLTGTRTAGQFLTPDSYPVSGFKVVGPR